MRWAPSITCIGRLANLDKRARLAFRCHVTRNQVEAPDSPASEPRAGPPGKSYHLAVEGCYLYSKAPYTRKRIQENGQAVLVGLAKDQETKGEGAGVSRGCSRTKKPDPKAPEVRLGSIMS